MSRSFVVGLPYRVSSSPRAAEVVAELIRGIRDVDYVCPLPDDWERWKDEAMWAQFRLSLLTRCPHQSSWRHRLASWILGFPQMEIVADA